MVKQTASTTAGRFFLSIANKMKAAQGGTVNKRMTHALVNPA